MTDSEIAQKQRQIRQLNEDIKNLSTHLSTLRRQNSTATFLNREQYSDYKKLKSEITGLLEGYLNTKIKLEEYHRGEISEIDREKYLSRTKMDKEMQEIENTKKTLRSQQENLNSLVGKYEEMIYVTGQQSRRVSVDYTKLQEELYKLGLERNQTNQLKRKLEQLHREIQDTLKDTQSLFTIELRKKNFRDEKLKTISELEDILTQKILRGKAENDINRDLLKEKETRLNEKEIQLNVRQASLQKLYDKLKNSGGV